MSEEEKYLKYVEKLGKIFQDDDLKGYEVQGILATSLLSLWLSNNSSTDIVEGKLKAMEKHYQIAYQEKNANV